MEKKGATLFAKLSQRFKDRDLQTSAAADECADKSEEITQKTAPLAGAGITIRQADVDWLVAVLEPLFFDTLPKLTHHRTLYLFNGVLPYLPLLVRKEPAQLLCLGPKEPTPAGVAGPVLLSDFSESCMKPNSFDAIVFPESAGVYFLPRAAYWASLVRPGGELFLAMTHPQLRFVLGDSHSQGARRRSSRTATFERLFERARENQLEIVAVREILLSQLAPAVLKKEAHWQRVHDLYDALPGVLGLHLRKKEG